MNHSGNQWKVTLPDTVYRFYPRLGSSCRCDCARFGQPSQITSLPSWTGTSPQSHLEADACRPDSMEL